MNNGVVIYPIENAWVVEWKFFLDGKREAYTTFDEVIERIKTILEVEYIEAQPSWREKQK